MVNKMENVFVVNPEAGQGIDAAEYSVFIEQEAEKCGKSVRIYVTKSVGDGERFVRELAEKSDGREIRVYSCGGDGTFNEVINGGIGHPNISFGLIPIGTGNDFCRNFSGCGDFLSIEEQLLGEEVLCDTIKYSGTVNGNYVEKYCANMFNIGFDANVCDLTAKLKTYPLIKGSFAYMISGFVTLIKKKGANLKIDSDGKTVYNGRLLLSSIANGSFCGGGIKCNPYANVSNGKINVNVIKDISRVKFLSIFPKYTKGIHINIKNIEKTILNFNSEKLTVIPITKKMKLCVDGEIYAAEKIEFEVVPKSIKVIVPKPAQNKVAQNEDGEALLAR